MKQSQAGRPQKYQGEIVPILRRVPKQKVKEIDQAIEKICEDLKTKKL